MIELCNVTIKSIYPEVVITLEGTTESKKRRNKSRPPKNGEDISIFNCRLDGVDLRPIFGKRHWINIQDSRFRNVKWPTAHKVLHMMDWTICNDEDLLFQFMLYNLHNLTKRPMKLETALERFQEWANLGPCPFRDCPKLRLEFSEYIDIWLTHFDPGAPIPPKPKANKLLSAALENCKNTGFKSYWKSHS